MKYPPYILVGPKGSRQLYTHHYDDVYKSWSNMDDATFADLIQNMEDVNIRWRQPKRLQGRIIRKVSK